MSVKCESCLGPATTTCGSLDQAMLNFCRPCLKRHLARDHDAEYRQAFYAFRRSVRRLQQEENHAR